MAFAPANFFGSRSLFSLLTAIPALALLTIFWAALATKKRRRRAARNILNQSLKTYSGEQHEYRIVSLDEFPSLDREFYNRTFEWFTTHGFKYLGDRQNLTLAEIYKHTSVLRTFISDDGTIVGTAYHLQRAKKTILHQTRIDVPQEFRIVEFETEFSDGTFLGTANTLKSARVAPIPGFDALRLMAETTPEDLLAAHRRRLTTVIAAGRSATVSRTMDDVIALQRRMHSFKSRHKANVGFVGPADIRALRGRELTPHEQAIADEIERLKKKL
jgi:hypothetical protein